LIRDIVIMGKKQAVVPWYSTGGITPVAVYQPKGAASYEASLINLITPGTYDATSAGAPAWDAATGWTFSLTTHLVTCPVGAFDEQIATIIVRYTTDGTNSTGHLFSSTGTAGDIKILPLNAGTNASYYNGSAAAAIAPIATGANVLAIAGSNGYRNGADECDLTFDAVVALNITIGNRPSGSRTFPGSIFAFAYYNSVLTPAQIAALTTAMNTL